MKRSRCHAIGIGACLLLLTACSSIPLATIWKMYGMTVERLFESDPRQLRVALRTDDAAKRGAGQPQMRIDIDAPSTKPICYAFALDPVVVDGPGEAKLEPSGKNRRWYAFGLSRKGLESFERARREVRLKDLGEVKLALNVTLDDVLIPAESANSMPFRVDLILDRKDGYFTMLNEIVMPINRDGDGKKSASVHAGDQPQSTNSSPAAVEPQAKPVCIPAA